jgi:hypothetical protein
MQAWETTDAEVIQSFQKSVLIFHHHGIRAAYTAAWQCDGLHTVPKES